MSNTITLTNGYDRTKNPETLTLRPLKGADLLTSYIPEMWARCNDGKARNVRFSGQPKTWKRRANIERPIKFGMYESTYATAENVAADVVVSGNGSGLYVRA